MDGGARVSGPTGQLFCAMTVDQNSAWKCMPMNENEFEFGIRSRSMERSSTIAKKSRRADMLLAAVAGGLTTAKPIKFHISSTIIDKEVLSLSWSSTL